MKAWQNPGGAYEAGRYEPNLQPEQGGACVYGWDGGEHWTSATMEVLWANGDYRWVPWDGVNHIGAVGWSTGTPHCQTYANYFGWGDIWLPGKISNGLCHVPAGGREFSTRPWGVRVQVLRDVRRWH